MTSPDSLLREALEELDGYLADSIAPLLVADAVERLLDYPPALTAEKLRIWSVFQYGARGGADALADLLYHALKKIQQLEELKLLPAERFAEFLRAVAAELLESCPDAERERFAGMLRYLHESPGGARVMVDRLHRAAAAAAAQRTGAPAAAPVSPDDLRDVRRFTLLLDRALAAGGDQGGGDSGTLGQQLLVLAASGAKDSTDLESRLARLREAGLAPTVSRELVRALVTSVPDWVFQLSGAAAPQSGSIEAVRRAVQLAGDGARTGERWKELLRAAAEQFNRGAFGRAVILIDLADRMVEDGEIDGRFAEVARARAHEAYDVTALLQAAADERSRPALRRLVEFHPGWSVRELLDAIVYEPDQKRRRLILLLIEIWGAEARQPIVDRLAAAVAEGSRDPNGWWYVRNLVYLLNRLPRHAGSDPRQELDLAAPFSTLGSHPSMQRETFHLLSQLPGELGVPTLIHRLGEAEAALRANPPPRPVEEIWKILNALAAALARSGSPAARRALLDHALTQRYAGDSLARLRELAWTDLAADREALGRLLGALRDVEPKRVLGFQVGGSEEAISHLVRALASTTAPEARAALAGLAERFPDRDFGRLAAGAAATGPRPPEPEADDEEIGPPPIAVEPRRAALSGDLEIFGLPGLLQSLEQSEASGSMVLRDARGEVFSRLRLVQGRLRDCRTGRLADRAAFYQIFEVPIAGSFEFTRGEPDAAGGPSLDLMALLMEGMRRYDDLQRIRAVVPDGAYLRAGEVRPTAPAEESDGELVRLVWTRARGGALTREIEAAAPVDAYRVRTLLAHWLEEGALVMEPAPI